MRSSAVLLGVAATLLAACGQPAPTHASAKVAPTAVGATAAPVLRHTPARLQIPAINVDAVVESLGVQRDQSLSGLAMAVPNDPAEVGWYSKGAAPGDGSGDVVMDGHLDSKTGPAVFWKLHLLQKGAKIVIVSDDGRSFTYQVSDISTPGYKENPVGLFATDGPAGLALITCTGKWDGTIYQQRLIVKATPV